MQFLTNDATSIKESISCENFYENKKTNDVGSLFRKFDGKTLWKVNLY